MIASDARPTIVVVAHRVDDSGGMERVHAELIRRLVDRYRFIVVASKIADDLKGKVEWRRVPLPSRVVPLRLLTFYILGAIQLRRTRADIVHVCGALVPNRADIASVHFCHTGFVANGKTASNVAPLNRRVNTRIHRRLAIAAEKWSYQPRRLRMLAPVSRQVADELRDGYPGIAIREVPNGVDLDRFRPDAAVRRLVRREFGTEDKITVALFVGGDWDRKGLSLAIDAVAFARASGALVELWALGSGDKRRFRAKAEAAGVAEAIRFLGKQSEAERYFQAADLYLCCSSYEAFSLALLEAAASALPLITTRVGGTAEILEEAREPVGLLVEPECVNVGSALLALANDEAWRIRCGDTARRRVGVFSWDRLAGDVDGIYRELLSSDA
jgi:glycosyltransferase involved in cell wall biosynthesis